MKKLYFILLFFFTIVLAFPTSAFCRQKFNLSDSAYASILTCGPGDEFYEIYGHTALRICDNATNIDYVFNYGTFDFDVSGFYFKFARGMLDYFVAIQRFSDFMFEYEYFGRAVWEQRLNITAEECSRLFNMLMENALPENKYYKYDFFRDNCATRIDDMIMKSISRTDNGDGDCELQTIIPENRRTTYRDLLYKYNVSMPWWQLGVDILLGARCDRPMTARQYRYIPMEMMAQYDTMRYADGGRVTCDKRQLLKDERVPMRRGVAPALTMWCFFLLVAALSLFAVKRGWRLYWLDALIFGAAVLVSALLLFMWFGSDHWCTKWNMNLLWANPLLLWPLLRLRKPKRADCLPMIAILLMVIVGWPFWPQHFNAAVLPIVLMILARLSVRVNRLVG